MCYCSLAVAAFVVLVLASVADAVPNRLAVEDRHGNRYLSPDHNVPEMWKETRCDACYTVVQELTGMFERMQRHSSRRKITSYHVEAELDSFCSLATFSKYHVALEPFASGRLSTQYMTEQPDVASMSAAWATNELVLTCAALNEDYDEAIISYVREHDVTPATSSLLFRRFCVQGLKRCPLDYVHRGAPPKVVPPPEAQPGDL